MNMLIVANKNNPATLDTFFQISAFCSSQGLNHSKIDVSDLPDAAFPYSATDEEVAARYGGPYDMIVTLGGDGTILRTSRLAYRLDAPILGINMGHLGFLANTADESVIAILADALSGEILQEDRVNLKVQVTCITDDKSNSDDVSDVSEDGSESNDAVRTFYAFNEIAIARGALGHIVDFNFSISGDKIASMRGDGLVVATATGSTAYSLSAGGPLVGPRHRGMIAVPLAPHTLNSRAIVAEHHDVVEVDFPEDSPSGSEISLFADGDVLAFNEPIANVQISVGEHPITLLTQRKESFYKQISRTFFQ